MLGLVLIWTIFASTICAGNSTVQLPEFPHRHDVRLRRQSPITLPEGTCNYTITVDLPVRIRNAWHCTFDRRGLISIPNCTTHVSPPPPPCAIPVFPMRIESTTTRPTTAVIHETTTDSTGTTATPTRPTTAVIHETTMDSTDTTATYGDCDNLDELNPTYRKRICENKTQCIYEFWWCDGLYDCMDGSDELNYHCLQPTTT